MSVLDVLDATRLCTRDTLADPAAWAVPVPATVRREPPATAPAGFSWWSLVRNPQALLLTGVIAAGIVRDGLLRVTENVPSPLA